LFFAASSSARAEARALSIRPIAGRLLGFRFKYDDRVASLGAFIDVLLFSGRRSQLSTPGMRALPDLEVRAGEDDAAAASEPRRQTVVRINSSRLLFSFCVRRILLVRPRRGFSRGVDHSRRAAAILCCSPGYRRRAPWDAEWSITARTASSSPRLLRRPEPPVARASGETGFIGWWALNSALRLRSGPDAVRGATRRMSS
jgi:hypothetical protein